MPSTIKDVAKKAKVSIATVSLVLHNNQRISTGTRRKVLKAVSDLNYRPSRIARGLVLRETKNIGFLLTHDHFLRTEPFYTHIFLGSEFEARDNEYYILLNAVPTSFAQHDSLPRFVLERNVDGIIIAGKIPQEIIDCLELYNLPFVFVDYYPQEGEYSAALIDNVDGAMQATQYLVECGHRAIGFIGGDLAHPSIRDRLQGYRMVLDKAQIIFKAKNVFTTESATTRESGYHATKELLGKNKNITAIFACNDAMAIGAMQFLKEYGYQIPRDISLIGFDDVTADLYTDPPLSTIRVPKVDLGAEAMRLLLEILNKKVKTPKKVLVPVELIKRKSVATISLN
jgi:LacI family transcriptional regulator